jgi:hypothetical protein
MSEKFAQSGHPDYDGNSALILHFDGPCFAQQNTILYPVSL